MEIMMVFPVRNNGVINSKLLTGSSAFLLELACLAGFGLLSGLETDSISF